MNRSNQAFVFFVNMFAGWLNYRQQKVMDTIRVEFAFHAVMRLAGHEAADEELSDTCPARDPRWISISMSPLCGCGASEGLLSLLSFATFYGISSEKNGTKQRVRYVSGHCRG